MKIYHKIRPQAMTAINIKLAFRKTGLNPFNLASAFRQLPSQPITPPRPTIPIEFQTSQNLHHLDLVKRKAKKLDNNTSESHLDDLRLIRMKIEKAATVAMAKEEILRQELKEL